MSKLVFVAVACVILALCGVQSLAQGETAYAFVDGKRYPSQSPPSFTAEYLTTYYEGSSVTLFRDAYTFVRFARDSQGRTRREEGQSFGDRPISDYSVSVDEPVARFDGRWNTAGDRVYVTHWGPVQHCPDPNLEAALKATTPDASAAAHPAPRPPQPPKPQADPEKIQDPTFEDLGTKNILGVEAQGYRSTEHISAGAQGNAEAFLLVKETWSAWGYGVLEEIVEDRTNGSISMKKVWKLDIGEPDPQLFTLPQGIETVEKWTEPVPCPGDSAHNRVESPAPHSSQ